MALRTSSQSGNFNSTSTWGGSAVPVDGDQFTVAAGHIVTVNDDRRVTNGYHDSIINGKLHITGSGKLRMNGILDVTSTGNDDYFTEGDSSTGAYFKMDNGAILEMKGVSGDNHRLRINSQKRNWVEFDGTNPNQTTTTSAAVPLNSTSISFTSGTGFASGDWINIFRALEDIADWEYDRYQDEGMIVHDVSGNTIYPRWFVSPNTTITRVAGNKIFVNDSTIFRVGQKIIFGTGSNRNIKTISSIGKTSGRITCDSSITGSVVGQTVYRTGTEIYHESGAQVQKIATHITGGGTSGSRTIQVASTAGMVVGQRLLIEANNDADTNWDYEMLYEIESISGNSVVLTENFAQTRLTGAWVTIYDRDTQIRSTDLTDTDKRVYVIMNRWTSGDAYYRRLRFRNVLFDGIGSNAVNTTWNRGVGWNGYMSYETTSYGNYASGVEGCVWKPNNSNSNAAFYMRDAHQVTWRNCIAYDGQHNFWRYAGGNNHNFNNNISWRSHYTTFLQDGAYEPRMFICYNHFSRSDDHGSLWYHHRQSNGQVRHNYWTHHEQRPIYIFYQGHNIIFENNYFNWFRTWPYIGSGGDIIHLNSYFGNDWDATTGNTSPTPGVQISQLGDLRPDRVNQPQSMYSINHNWKDGETAQWGSYIWREWDDNENAWKTFRDTSTNNVAGIAESVYVPAGATVYLAGEIKISTGFSGNRPYLRAQHANSHHMGRHYDGSTTSTQASETTANTYPIGHQESVQFTASAIGAYERQTLTISPTTYDYYLSVSIYSDSANAADNLEHWHQKPIEIYIDKGTGIKEKKFLVQHQSRRGFNQSTTRRKKRIGGRIT